VQKLNWSNPVYKGENYFYLNQIPIYGIFSRKWVRRVRTGGIIELPLDFGYADHTFRIGHISSNSGFMMVNSIKDTRVKLWISPTAIKNIIKE
jgi:hypothetical protein